MPRAGISSRGRGSSKEPGGPSAPRSSKGASAGLGSVVIRALPAVLLPLAVGAFQWTQGTGSVLLVVVALALGVTLSVAVRNGLIATVTTAVSIGLLVSAGYVQSLQVEEASLGSGAGAAEPEQRLGPAAADAAHPDAAELAPTTMETMSVVLPCAFEGNYAVKTVESLRTHTKRHRLKEIIVVDDGSNPPLSSKFPQQLLRGSKEAPVRLLRHEKTRGLIAAKKTGGDAAVGDVIVFFDCHVKPRNGWEEAFLRQMKRAGDHRTVVVPTITSLDPETWEESRFGAQSKACYLLWNADFTWLGNPGRDVPLMSGGLLALSRRWWQETEGYDPHMVAWGGENIDQSLRAWLCGGRIEVAEGAFVAHMWRDPNNPKTQLKYPIPTEDVMRNKARAVTAWLDEFKEKTLSFPEYEAFVSGKQALGDMSNFDRLRKKLNCEPFSAYIQRFSYVYIDTGLIPSEVFQLREESTGRCLERAPREHPPHGIVLAPCAGNSDQEGQEGGVPELQLWHAGNRDQSRGGAPCCSGLVNWNFIQCLDAHSIGGHATTFECEISGHALSQSFKLQPDSSAGDGSGQLVWQNGAACLVPAESKDPGATAEAAVEACRVKAQPSSEAGSFALRVGDSCATSISSGGDDEGGAPEAMWHIEFQECREGDKRQLFQSLSMLGGLQVKVGDSGNCLDAAGGSQLLVYPCYAESTGNENQIFQLRGGGSLVWEGPVSRGGIKAFCAELKGTGLGFHEVPTGQRLNLRTCASKFGQRLRKSDVQRAASSASDETFLLLDADTGKCLGSLGASGGGGLEHMMKFGECSEKQRWRELKDRDQLQHVATKLCVDAGDEVSPILYPCHEPKAMRKQRFRVLDSPGWVQMRSGWEDNGRKRYFEKCLDHSPEPLAEAAVQSCDVARQKGIRWRKVGSRVPPERSLWTKASTAPPGSVGLGGGAAPP